MTSTCLQRGAPVIVFGANTPWVYALSSALSQRGRRVSAVALYDAFNYWRLRPSWPNGETGEQRSGLDRSFWVYPPGYVGSLERIFRPLLRTRLSFLRAKLRVQSGGKEPWVIAPYPWYVGSLRDVPPERFVYYNLDDYILYRRNRQAAVRRQEAETVQRAALTMCLSYTQVEDLREKFPSRRTDIRHLPLGVVEALINPIENVKVEPNTVGYIGNLFDRVDWRFVRKVAAALPAVRFRFVGGLDGFSDGGQRSDWRTERDAVLALPNVDHIGSVRQEEVGPYYWRCAANWIPYAVDHRFNVASCPTKIMDGIASGRPLLSTDIPECRLYPEWITVTRSPEDAVARLRECLREHRPEECAVSQTQFARLQTWAHRGETLNSWLGQCEAAKN